MRELGGAWELGLTDMVISVQVGACQKLRSEKIAVQGCECMSVVAILRQTPVPK